MRKQEGCINSGVNNGCTGFGGNCPYLKRSKFYAGEEGGSNFLHSRHGQCALTGDRKTAGIDYKDDSPFIKR